MYRRLETAVSVLKVTACVTCPMHKSIYKQLQEKFGWQTKLVNVHCKKLGGNVCVTGIDSRCPLPKWEEAV
jgi:hypothetical protein